MNQSEEPAKKKLKVLVADDDRLQRQLIRIIMSDAGFEEFYEAESGEGAINLLKDIEFDLAILDIHMPPIDGITLSKYIRSTRSSNMAEMPIVVVTASCDEDTVHKVRNAGCDQLCLKPLNPENLLRRVEAAFANRLAALRPAPMRPMTRFAFGQ